MDSTTYIVTSLLLIITLSISCTNPNASPPLMNEIIIDTADYYYYELRDDTIRKVHGLKDNALVSENYYLVSKNNMGCGQVNVDPNPNIITLHMEVIIDNTFRQDPDFNVDTTIDVGLINKMLSKLNFGYEIVIDTTYFSDELQHIDTDGKINQDNIFSVIPQNVDLVDWHIYLFNRSDFFNTANAITLQNDSEKYILGDGHLLLTPMLLIHEMGHALGLTHSNEIYGEECRYYNVMHESNIGCARYLSHRQFFIAHTDRYIEPFIEQDIQDSLSRCDCERNGMDNNAERYINSFDRNIDDLPIVDDYATLFNKYKFELTTPDALDTNIQNSLTANYLKEWELMVKGYGPMDSVTYVQRRLETHKKLRKNNLARWLIHTQEELGILDTSQYYFDRDFAFYEEEFVKLRNASCEDIHNEIYNLSSCLRALKEKLKIWKPEGELPIDTSSYECFDQIFGLPRESAGFSSRSEIQNNIGIGNAEELILDLILQQNF